VAPEILRLGEEAETGSGGSSGSSGSGGSPKRKSRWPCSSGAASATAFAYDQSEEDDTRKERDTAEDDQMMVLLER